MRRKEEKAVKVFFLGTGAGVPAKARNVTSIALKLLDERRAIWLFDCGEATQHQILHTTIKPRRIEKVFITHLHGDHIYGLPGFLASRSHQGGKEKLTVYGPKGIKEYIEVSLSVSQTYLQYPLEIIEIDEGVVCYDDQFIVTAKKLDHGIPSFGYRVVEKDLPGTLMADQLIEDGVRPGPIFKRIKEGETITLEDGRIINPKDYVGPPQMGRIVTILGDTRFCSAAIELARNANLLVHEATFANGEEQLAHDYYHSTIAQAAAVAEQAGVEQLCLTHISSRYERSEWSQLEEQAKVDFPAAILAEDFKEIDIPRK